MDNRERDIDGRSYYMGLTDPDVTFNRTEITLSHIFRKPTDVLGNQTYSQRLFEYLASNDYLKPEIVEVGGGLGDVAFGFLVSKLGQGCERYELCDISPRLLDRQKRTLEKLASRFLVVDSIALSRSVSPFCGLILSNGMIADLRSVYLSPNHSLHDYDIADPDIIEFANDLGLAERGAYLHLGALLFLREVSSVLLPGGTAAILEYGATRLNQPSWFNDHYECGIDFRQIGQYAQRLGFEQKLVPIDEILRLPEDHAFLTMDVFTSQGRIARERPGATALWQSKRMLPVLAYSRDRLRSVLTELRMGLSRAQVASVLSALDDCFFSIHDRRFDTKNPTTWSYQALLLRKQSVDDWRSAAEPVAASVLSDFFGVSKEQASNQWHEADQETSMGPGIGGDIIISVLGGIIYDLVKHLGKRVWACLFQQRVEAWLHESRASNEVRVKLLNAVRRAVRQHYHGRPSGRP